VASSFARCRSARAPRLYVHNTHALSRNSSRSVNANTPKGRRTQTRWQEMKWGCVFCKEKRKMGVLFGKKSGKWFFFVKKWAFPQRRVHYIQYFLFYILLIWGAYAPAPPAYGLGTLAALSADIVGSRCFGRPT